MSETIKFLTEKLAMILVSRSNKICTAESCTGGLIAKSFTDLAGSSEWFDRGFVTYSNEAKMDMLGVQSSTLDKNGAVSEEVATEMAIGALQRSHAQLAIAVTGIAGPGGGSDSKPVGTVCFGFAGKLADKHSAEKIEVVVEKKRFEGDRAQVRESSLLFAINRITSLLTTDFINKKNIERLML